MGIAVSPVVDILARLARDSSSESVRLAETFPRLLGVRRLGRLLWSRIFHWVGIALELGTAAHSSPVRYSLL